ncbi:ECF transporter S component [Ruminococcaceae bacterium OttesenSCG-928-O06]|nr:ECF transporter S component [Ruminococcaceae bacterium OttesenSCG-928-O06]
MKVNNKTRILVQFSLLLALQIILGVTPLGLIMVPPVAITLLHIPVIICGITMGPLFGGLLGASFGLISLTKAITSAVSPIDLLFNPLVSGNAVASVIMCLVPRILLGVFAALLFKLMKRLVKRNLLSIGIAAALATALHTIMVLGCLFLFFSAIPLMTVFGSVITLNGGLEITAAILVAAPVCNALLRYTGNGAKTAPATTAP